MDAFLTQLIKQQNQFLLAQIAKDFKKDEKKLKKMYWTPSFYSVVFDNKKYVIQPK